MVSIMHKKCVVTAIFYTMDCMEIIIILKNTSDKLQYFGWMGTEVWGCETSTNISKARRRQSRSQSL